MNDGSYIRTCLSKNKMSNVCLKSTEIIRLKKLFLLTILCTLRHLVVLPQLYTEQIRGDTLMIFGLWKFGTGYFY